LFSGQGRASRDKRGEKAFCGEHQIPSAKVVALTFKIEQEMRNEKLNLAVLAGMVIFYQSQPSQYDIQANADQTRLKEILQKTGEYCHRLENAVFDFVCLEEITEKIRQSPEFRKELPMERDSLGIPQLQVIERTKKNKYLYEYQLIGKKEKSEERRTLLEKNGKKKIQKEARLETSRLYYENIVFGPIDLFRRFGQLYLDWRVVNEETMNQEKVVVIEAVPKSGLTQFYPYGKIWLSESDSGIMKIEWNEKSITNYQFIEEQAKKSNAEPWITLISEFGVKKNGIRFPSRLVCEEAYINRQGKKAKSSETTVVYRDYKFFTVDVDVKY
jgi:hypothetical protein